MPTIWYNAEILDIQPVNDSVRRFFMVIPDFPDFRAGQFITLDLPLGEKRQQRWRSYSIASAPGARTIELCISRIEQGAGTSFLFDTLQVGDVIRCKGPEGNFTLPESLDMDLVMVCTGTGVAPFRSMLLHLAKQNINHQKLHLIFGCRTEADILYRDEFEQLTRQLPAFRYDVALSRQENWIGFKGHLHQIYLKEYRDSRPDVLFMCCGWRAMIDEAVANLIVGLGYDRSQVRFELYG
jgi:CDP-4-dehydro-6-deoxyglucose reductase